MSYDFCLFRLEPGQSAGAKFRTLMESRESDALGAPDPATEKLKAEIAAAITASWPWMMPFVFDYQEVARALSTSEADARLRFRHIEFNDDRKPTRGIQLTVHDNHISITLPYWHQQSAAESVFADVAAFCDVLSKRWGFVVFDPQLDDTVEASAIVQRSTPSYLRVMGAMPGIIKKATAKAARPWWKFW